MSRAPLAANTLFRICVRNARKSRLLILLFTSLKLSDSDTFVGVFKHFDDIGSSAPACKGGAGGRATNAVGTIFRKIFVGTRACPI